jgi:hypothetical protein
VGRYLSAGNDPSKLAAYNQLHDIPIGRHTFRVLSVVWGIGLVIEAGFRMVLAEALHTNTFVAISPFITATVIGSLFAFTVVYSKQAQLEAATLMAQPAGASAGDGAPTPTPMPTPSDGSGAAGPDSPPSID